MSAHTRKIEPPRCQSCRGRASVEVFNQFNSSCGYYCARCGNAKLKDLRRREESPAE